MNFLRTGKLRFLYWLALAQLVGGPLVLLQVTVFCKLALHEAPQMGVATAAVRAWQSDEFQAVLAEAGPARKGEHRSWPPADDPNLKFEKSKLPAIPWEPAPLHLTNLSRHCKIVDCVRTWTPAWPQAPPGPPPRLG